MKRLRCFLVAAATLVPASAHAGDYVLLYAIDNDETVIKRDLTREECRKMKADLISSGEIKVEGAVEDPNLGVLACILASDL